MTDIHSTVRDYLGHVRVERGLSANTLAAYRRDLERYVAFLGTRGVTDLAEVTPVELSEFVRGLTGTMARASVARTVVSVRNLHSFAQSEGILDANPASDLHPPKLERRLPKALSVAQVEALLATPDRSDGVGLRDAALLELLYGTGGSVSEVCGLDVDDVQAALADPDEGLLLRGKGGKERVVPLGSWARSAVADYLVRARPALSRLAGRASPALLLNQRGGRLSRQSAWAIIAGAAEGAGIAGEVSPHSLRHSFATHLLDGGADVRVVQELLGHASVATTQIYTLVTVEHLREVYLGAHPRAR